MPRLRALDGIRALAVLAVVLTHTHFPAVHGGGYGVDVFFALSGFLITWLLLKEHARDGRISRRNFYRRRALRLLPALAVCIAVTVILDVTANAGGGHLATAVPAAIFYYGNWLVAHDGQALGFLGQTWSLAIEEQFYIVWPLLLVVPAVRRRLPLWLGGYVALAALARVAVTASHGSAVVWTPFRADELAIGAFLAAWLHQGRAVPRWLGSSASAVVCILVVIGLVLHPLPETGLGSLGLDVVAVCTVIVIAHVVTRPDSGVIRALSWSPAVVLGKVSYGVYLYHYAILAWCFARGWSVTRTILIAWPITAVLTTLSWRYVERPALARKDRVTVEPPATASLQSAEVAP